MMSHRIQSTNAGSASEPQEGGSERLAGRLDHRPALATPGCLIPRTCCLVSFSAWALLGTLSGCTASSLLYHTWKKRRKGRVKSEQ